MFLYLAGCANHFFVVPGKVGLDCQWTKKKTETQKNTDKITDKQKERPC